MKEAMLVKQPKIRNLSSLCRFIKFSNIQKTFLKMMFSQHYLQIEKSERKEREPLLKVCIFFIASSDFAALFDSF